MKILITGKGGQLADQFIERLKKSNVMALSKSELDITDHKKTKKTIEDFRPHLIINCAAYNNVDEAEKNNKLANKVNSEAVRNIAEIAADNDIKLIHFSTDYIFTGNQTEPYNETDIPDPMNEYGKSKLAGEQAIKEQEDLRYLILRTSWVYGKGKQNFIHKLLGWSEGGADLKIAVDEMSIPTSCPIIVEIAIRAIKKKLTGTYHVTNSGYASRFDWAQEILKLHNLNNKLTPVSREDFGLPAARPRFSVLSNAKISADLGIKIPDWQVELANQINNLKS